MKGRDKISDFLVDGCPLTQIEIDKSTPYRSPQFGAFDGTGDVKGVQFFFNFTSKTGVGQGLARLAEKDGQWKIFTFFTTLRDIKGHEEATYHRRPKGVEHGGKPDRKNWQERRTAAINFQGKEPTVLIVGMLTLCLLIEPPLTILRRRPGRVDGSCPFANARSRHSHY